MKCSPPFGREAVEQFTIDYFHYIRQPTYATRANLLATAPLEVAAIAAIPGGGLGRRTCVKGFIDLLTADKSILSTRLPIVPTSAAIVRPSHAVEAAMFLGHTCGNRGHRCGASLRAGAAFPHRQPPLEIAAIIAIPGGGLGRQGTSNV
jgi:hypothetical protein